MTVNLGKSKVKDLIIALLEMPMDSDVEVCVVDDEVKYQNIHSVYTDEYNGHKKVIIK